MIGETQALVSRWLVQPEHYLRFAWEMFVMTILVMFGFLLPYASAFKTNDKGLSDAINFLSCTVFSIDILINFNTGYYDKGMLIMDRAKIIKKYISFWFWIDLVSTIPLDWVLESAGSSNSKAGLTLKYIRILRILKLIKLVRLTRLQMMIIKIKDRISNKKLLTFISSIRLLLYLFLTANFFACIMYSVSSESYGTDNFISLIINKSDNIVHSDSELYVSCLYWAVTTMAGIGYGDYSPRTTTERTVGIFTMIISSGMFGFIIGNMGSELEKHSLKAKNKREAIVNLNYYLKLHKVDPELKSRARTYLDFALANNHNSSMKIGDLLKNLSVPLQQEIMMHTHGSLLIGFKLFALFDQSLIARFSGILESRIFSPGDNVIKENRESKGMFFIIKGLIEVYDDVTECSIQVLSDGSYVGEIGLFLKRNCVASVDAIYFTEAFCLTYGNFHNTIGKLPQAKLIVDNIIKSCENDNYEALGVQCYLCKHVGHIAAHCDRVMNDENSRREWINRRHKSKLINLRKTVKNKKERFVSPKVSRRDYSARNIIGVKRQPREMFNNSTSIVRGIVGYIQRNNIIIRDASPRLITEESSIGGYTARTFANYDFVLSESDEENRAMIIKERDAIEFDLRLIN